MACVFLSKVVNVSVPFYFKYAIDAIVTQAGSSSIGSSGTTTDVIAHYAPVVPISLGVILCGYGLSKTAATLLNECRASLFEHVTQNAVRDVSVSSFRQVCRMPHTFHVNRDTATLTRTLSRGARAVDTLLSTLALHIVPTALEIALVGTVLASQYPPAFLGVLGVTVVAYFLWTIKISRLRMVQRRELIQWENRTSSSMLDTLMNHETVRYFDRDAHEISRYETCLRALGESSIQSQRSLSQMNVGQQAVWAAGLAAMMVLATRGIMEHTMTIGDLVAIHGLMFQLAVPLHFMGTTYREFLRARFDLQELLTLTSTNTTRLPTQTQSPAPHTLTTLHPCKYAIELDRVSVVKDGRSILTDCSLTVPVGSRVALVGPSGSGKSTLLHLLFRFYEPTAGRVLIGERDVRDMCVSSLRQRIGIVPQETVLFHDTLLYNIRYGRPDATAEQVHEAARQAHLLPLIERLPERYDTRVGERGMKLSGGEKQRIAIARMLLKKPDILVCDEATSALDMLTERILLTNLRHGPFSAGKTMMCVSHRLASIMDMDYIYVMQQGKIVEHGTHIELIRRFDGVYAQMWSHQARMGGGGSESKDGGGGGGRCGYDLKKKSHASSE